MNRIGSGVLLGVAIAAVVGLDARAVDAQTTFQACRVPGVGAIYMINVAGAPSACLDAAHVAFSWTEGGAPADGSVTTAKIANGAVTTAKLAVPPKVAYTIGASSSLTLIATRVNLGSVAITVGGAGSIVVTAAGTLEASAGNCAYVYYGISETSTGVPNNRESYMNRGDYGATGVHTFGYQAMSSVYVDTVTAAGTYTYYFVATDFGAAGNCDAYNNGITAIFIPS